MKTIAITLLVLSFAAAALLSALPAVAQGQPQQDPCGPPLRSGYVAEMGQPTQSPYSYDTSGNNYASGSGSYNYGSGYPGGYGDEYSYGPTATPRPTPTPTPIPQPANPLTKICEFGAVQIIVHTDRYFTYRIGDRIRLEIDIITDPSVQIDFSTIESRQLLLDVLVTDFEVADTPVITTTEMQDGKVRHNIQLTLQTWRMRPLLWFTMELRYATGFESDGLTPDWKRLVTPQFQLTTSPTHDHGEEPIVGDFAQGETQQPVAAAPLFIIGFMLVMLAPTILLAVWLSRRRPGRVIPPEEIAWSKLNQAFLAGDSNGYGRKECEAVVSAVLTYVDGGAMRSATPKEVLAYLAQVSHAQAPAIKRVVERLERIIIARAGLELKLERHEVDQLKRDVSAIVPRPQW